MPGKQSDVTVLVDTTSVPNTESQVYVVDTALAIGRASCCTATRVTGAHGHWSSLKRGRDQPQCGEEGGQRGQRLLRRPKLRLRLPLSVYTLARPCSNSKRDPPSHPTIQQTLFGAASQRRDRLVEAV